MKNRDKLAGMALYDLLCRMNYNYFQKQAGCVLEMIVGEEIECVTITPCKDCIAAWLNEEAEDDVD